MIAMTRRPPTGLFDRKPLVVAALHLPPLQRAASPSQAELEDYVLANCAVFARAGVPAVKLQDETREPGRAPAATVATMASLGRLIRAEFPDLVLGIILQAHDPVGPIAVARACGAAFVRLKVFVGAAVTSDGLREALGVEAVAYRDAIGAGHVAILADAHDRTCYPLGGVPNESAALWAEAVGADAVVLTGSTFEDSLARIEAARRAGLARPVLIGGSVDAGNVAAALAKADGVIVSSALKRKAAPGELVQWDEDKVARFMDAARNV
jgi:hypothetical protein